MSVSGEHPEAQLPQRLGQGHQEGGRGVRLGGRGVHALVVRRQLRRGSADEKVLRVNHFHFSAGEELTPRSRAWRTSARNPRSSSLKSQGSTQDLQGQARSQVNPWESWEVEGGLSLFSFLFFFLFFFFLSILQSPSPSSSFFESKKPKPPNCGETQTRNKKPRKQKNGVSCYLLCVQ